MSFSLLTMCFIHIINMMYWLKSWVLGDISTQRAVLGQPILISSVSLLKMLNSRSNESEFDFKQDTKVIDMHIKFWESN